MTLKPNVTEDKKAVTKVTIKMTTSIFPSNTIIVKIVLEGNGRKTYNNAYFQIRNA